MPSKPNDQLPAAVEHLRSWAAAQRVAWVPGTLSETASQCPRVQFQAEGDYESPLASAKAFARALGELEVAMLVVSIVTLDEDSQRGAVAIFEDQPGALGTGDAEGMPVRYEALSSQAHAAGKHIGEPGSVLISAITRNPPVAIDWSETADWYFVIEAADMLYDDMAYDDVEDVDVGAHGEDSDYDEWQEIEIESPPEPPPPPRRVGRMR